MRCSTAVWWAIAAAITSAGCVSGASDLPPRPDAGRRDAGQDAGSVAEDAGSDPQDSGTDPGDASMELDAAEPEDASSDAGDLDAGIDAGALDGGADAGADASSMMDAGGGGTVPTIDGVVNEAEWIGAEVVTNDLVSDWTGSSVQEIRARLLSTGLYVAIRGSSASTPRNAIVIYVDRAAGTSEGVILDTLSDTSGALDDALTPGSSLPIMTPTGFRADLAWGTFDFGRGAEVFDDRMGWRDFVRAASPSDLYWVPSSDAPTVCGASACETMLPRALLDAGAGGSRPRTVSLFARINRPDGEDSANQTLPSDDASQPRNVMMLLTLLE